MLQYKIKIYEKEYIEVYLNLVEARGKLKKIVKVKQKKKNNSNTFNFFKLHGRFLDSTCYLFLFFQGY